MRPFMINDRDQSMTTIVGYKNSIPVARGLAFALYHIDLHGGHIDLFSGDRTMGAIKDFNKTFHKSLSGQYYLWANQWRPGFNPANSPLTTSHCYRSDGNPAYRVRGEQIPAKGKLPWHMCGLDIADKGKFEDVSNFLKVARGLGYEVTQPYRTGSETHHVVFTKSPISILESRNVISKQRG